MGVMFMTLNGSMKLEKLLLQKKSTILDRWLQLILETYPADAQRFLKKQKDRFANPVGTTISKETENLYKQLLQRVETESLSASLHRIFRIRAVQDFSPSQAVAFIFLLKRVIREELKSEIPENRLFDELMIIESRIDDMALLGFDIYMRCREKIYEIRANEAKNRVSRLLQKSGLISEIPDWKPRLKGDDAI
jgi:hypothetical protein